MKKDKLPLISVIVPVYNCEKYLGQCLDSLLNQSYENIQVIAVNDGSSDRSERILKEYANNNTRLEFLSTENRGQSAARNLALSKAKGEFIGFMDADDWADISMYEKLINHALRTKSDIVACEFVNYFDNNAENHTFKFRTKDSNIFENSVSEKPGLYIAVGNYFPNKIFHKQIFADKKIRFPEGQYFEDSWLMPDVLKRANRIAAVKEPLFFYRRGNNNSTTTIFNASVFYDAFKSADKILSHFEKNHIEDQVHQKVKTKLVAIVLFSRINALLAMHPKADDDLIAARKYVNDVYFYLDTKLQNWKVDYKISKLRKTTPKFLARTGRETALSLLELSPNEMNQLSNKLKSEYNEYLVKKERSKRKKRPFKSKVRNKIMRLLKGLLHD